MKMTKPTTAEQVEKFVAACKQHGFKFLVKSYSVVCITKPFQKGSMEEYASCDMFAYDVISLAPLKGGSVWGTTSDGVGGYLAVQNGCYILNKSGNGKRFLAALLKVSQ